LSCEAAAKASAKREAATALDGANDSNPKRPAVEIVAPPHIAATINGCASSAILHPNDANFALEIETTLRGSDSCIARYDSISPWLLNAGESEFLAPDAHDLE
jgi:hypothetical protein